MLLPARRRAIASAVAGVVALTLAACDPAPPDPPAPPSASVPASSGSPSPTVSIQDQDYAAAAEAFKNANRVIDEALIVGDGKIPEKELAKYAVPDGRYWLTETQGIQQAAKAEQRIVGKTKVVVVLPVGQYTPNQVTMYACYDGRDVKVVDGDGTTRSGQLVAARLTFRKAEGQWRVLGYETGPDGKDKNFQPVDRCDEEPA